MTAQSFPDVAPCPMCGAYSISPATQSSALLAVCDVLVVHALEKVGNWIVRIDRSRYARINGQPRYLAHTMWRPDTTMIDKALRGAWDVVPALLTEHGCCNITAVEVTRTLDGYVRDLLVTGTPHQLGELRYRFEAHLGIPLQPPAHTHAEESDRVAAP